VAVSEAAGACVGAGVAQVWVESTRACAVQRTRTSADTDFCGPTFRKWVAVTWERHTASSPLAAMRTQWVPSRCWVESKPGNTAFQLASIWARWRHNSSMTPRAAKSVKHKGWRSEPPPTAGARTLRADTHTHTHTHSHTHNAVPGLCCASSTGADTMLPRTGIGELSIRLAVCGVSHAYCDRVLHVAQPRWRLGAHPTNSL
jgi:hypothetical protein